MKLRILFLNALGVLGGVSVGMMLAAALLITDKELMWDNARSFWSQVLWLS